MHKLKSFLLIAVGLSFSLSVYADAQMFKGIARMRYGHTDFKPTDHPTYISSTTCEKSTYSNLLSVTERGIVRERR